MRRISTVGVCVLAMLALGAVAVSSASAASPEYVTCAKVKKSGKTYTGKYGNKTCSEVNAKGEGKYERAPLVKAAKFKGTIGHVTIYLYDPLTESIEGRFECTGGKDSGSVTNSHEGTLSIAYSGCEATGEKLKGPCNSPGAKAGVVTSSALTTKLVWLNEEESEPGIEFKAVSGGIAAVECSHIETAELVGTMTAKIGPTKETSKSQTMTMVASATNGKPELSGQWEGAVFHEEALKSNLTGFIAHEGVPTSQTSTFTQKGPDVLIS